MSAPDPVQHAASASRAAGHGLGKQLGPFPVGVWLLVIAGGVGLTMLGGRRRTVNPPAGLLVDPQAVDSSLPAAIDPTGGAAGVQPGADGVSYGYGFADGFTAWMDRYGNGSDPSQPVNTPDAGGTTEPITPVPVPTRDEPATAPAPAAVVPAPAAPAGWKPPPTQPARESIIPPGVSTRDLWTFDLNSAQTLLHGGTVVGGDGRTMKLDPATGKAFTVSYTRVM